MVSRKELQDRAETVARKSEDAAKKDAALKAERQAEAESIEVKTEKLRALRMAKESPKPSQPKKKRPPGR